MVLIKNNINWEIYREKQLLYTAIIKKKSFDPAKKNNWKLYLELTTIYSNRKNIKFMVLIKKTLTGKFIERNNYYIE